MEASAFELPLASTLSHGFPMIGVVDDSFCVPCPTEITVKKKYHGFFLNQRYEVLDANRSLLLQVDGSSLNIHKKRIMRDAAGSPILTMREKIKLLTLQHRWMVHRGRSSDQKDIIFGVQRSHPLDMIPKLDVFMAINMNEGISNFQLVGSYIDKSCKIYKGNNTIAEVTMSVVMIRRAMSFHFRRVASVVVRVSDNFSSIDPHEPYVYVVHHARICPC